MCKFPVRTFLLSLCLTLTSPPPLFPPHPRYDFSPSPSLFQFPSVPSPLSLLLPFSSPCSVPPLYADGYSFNFPPHLSFLSPSFPLYLRLSPLACSLYSSLSDLRLSLSLSLPPFSLCVYHSPLPVFLIPHLSSLSLIHPPVLAVRPTLYSWRPKTQLSRRTRRKRTYCS